MKKIAVLMLCHKNPEQINLLLEALKHPLVDIYIHVDLKCQYIIKDIKANCGVHLLPKEKCVDVRWAQFSEIEATLNLINEASLNDKYSHYVLISGQDFPLKPIDEIVTFLNEYANDNFIDCRTVKKFEKRNDISFPSIVLGTRIWRKIAKNILVYITGGWNNTFSFIKRKAPNNVNYYFGSQWWALNNEAIKYIQDYLASNLNYQIFFKKSLCPDECFFQTLIMNSKYADSVKPYLHYINWKDGKSSPEILRVDDYDDLVLSNKFFARKFDIGIDREIIKRIISKISNSLHLI